MKASSKFLINFKIWKLTIDTLKASLKPRLSLKKSKRKKIKRK
jgi:hypothetical protein